MPPLILVGLEQDRDLDQIVSQTEVSEFLGVEFVSAYLSQRGIESKVLHGSVSVDDILIEEPSAVGFSVLASNYEGSKRMSRELKSANPELKIIWGGPQASTFYDEVLSQEIVDYVVLGEGEKTTFELMSDLQLNSHSVRGIVFNKKGKIIRNPPQTRLTKPELDSIEFKLIHNEDYSKFAMRIPHSVPYSKMRFANVAGSRGCWNDCSFCSSGALWGRRMSYRSPENIVDEIDFLVREKDVNYIFFSDDDFLVNASWVQEIAQGIIRIGLDVKYYVMASVRSAAKFNSYDLLRRSGCAEITLGVETTKQSLLDSIGKGYELSTLPYVANEISSHGIHFGLYFMMGYPEQTYRDLVEDYNFVKELPFSRIRPVFIVPFPGTRFYSEVEEKNLWLNGYKNNWPMLNCDRPVIKSKATPEQLVEMRKKVMGLYLGEDYRLRMLDFIENDPLSLKAFEEFQDNVSAFSSF